MSTLSKKVGTHYIQANGTPMLMRLGVAEALNEAGAVRNGNVAWTRYGWVKPIRKADGYGYSVRRQVIETPGVDFFPDEILCELFRKDGRATGVRVTKLWPHLRPEGLLS